MRNQTNKIVKAISFLFLILAFNASIAQNATSKVSEYKCIITNDIQTSGSVMEFDLYLLDSDPSEPFELASIQIGILVNPAIYNGGIVTASIVEGSSELNDFQQPSNIVFTQASNIVKIAGRIIKPSGKSEPEAVRGTIISAISPGSRICRVRLTNTKSFDKFPADLTFNFNTMPYPTIISQYISGTNTPLPRNSSNCISKASNVPLK